MYELKKLSPDFVASALEKVERYRFLKEPWEAESICLDILAVDPHNQQALIDLILARTDQFTSERGARLPDAQMLLERLTGEYDRTYYSGLICERQAGVHLHRNGPGDGEIAHGWLVKAMDYYERAEALRPPGNEDAILRWNTCARSIMRHEHVEAASDVGGPLMLE